MRPIALTTLTAFGLLFLASGITAETAGSPYVPPQLKTTIDSLQKLKQNLDRFQGEETNLRKKADKLAKEIDRLRSDPKGGFLERRKLRSKLQQSVEIGERLEHLELAETGLTHDLAEVGRRALALYQTAIDSTFRRIETVEAAREKRRLLESLLQLRSQKENLLGYLPDLPELVDANPELEAIGPFDSPAEINAKGDFYLDLAERLEKEATELDLLLDDLKQERMVREKVSELAEDTELFQGSDDFTVEEVPLAPPTAPTTEIREVFGAPEPLEKTPIQPVDKIGQDYLNFLFNQKISPQQHETRTWTLIDLIRQTETRQKQLKDRAGLYREKALEYYQRASEE